MFINPQALASVSDDRGNTVWFKTKMTFRDNAAVEEALLKMKFKQGNIGKAGNGQGDDATIDMNVAFSNQKLALLQANIKRWEGPDFVDENGRPIPCTPQNIALLDPDNPLVDKVVEELNLRNMPQTEAPLEGEPADPNLPDPSTLDELRMDGELS